MMVRMAARSAPPPRSAQAQAWVLGAIDLVRALKLAGIPTVVVAGRQDPARYSRAAVATVDPAAPSQDPEAMVASLLALASHQRELPVLYYDNDSDLLLVSRHRERLACGFRFVMPSAELVEDLVDKGRFQALARAARASGPACGAVLEPCNGRRSRAALPARRQAHQPACRRLEWRGAREGRAHR